MPLLVLSPRFSSDSRLLATTAVNLGWEKMRLHEWRVSNELRGRKDLVLYGEQLFAELLRDELGLQLCNPPDDLLTLLPIQLCRRRIEFMTYEQARKTTSARFIKPPDFKSFKAKVYASGAELPTPADKAEAEQSVLLSEVVHWDVEFRAFVLDGNIVDLSAYARDGELNASPIQDEEWQATDDERRNASLCVGNVLNCGIPLPRACVIDVGHIRGKGWAVVEANPAWGSGIYGCDPVKVLQVIQHAIIQAQ